MIMKLSPHARVTRDTCVCDVLHCHVTCLCHSSRKQLSLPGTISAKITPELISPHAQLSIWCCCSTQNEIETSCWLET